MAQTALGLYPELSEGDQSATGSPNATLGAKHVLRNPKPASGVDESHSYPRSAADTFAAPRAIYEFKPIRGIVTSRPAEFEKKEVRPKPILVQEWEGVVDRVEGDVFSGHMRPIVGEKESQEFTEVGEFDLATLNAREIEHVKPGARFRWQIGVLWQGANRYDYQHLYLPSQLAITEAEKSRIDEDVERFHSLFKA